MLDLKSLFEKHASEYGKFDRVSPKFSKRSDINALILLDKIIPFNDGPIIALAEHDVIYLSISSIYLARNATEEQIIDLIRCGISLDENDDLFLFT